MKWRHYWPETLLAVLVVALESPAWSWNSHSSGVVKAGWTSLKKLEAREKTRDLWYHGFNNYMSHAFPMDELAPLTCRGRGPDWNNPGNHVYNDVAGNFSVTLVDSLDTLVVLNDRSGFESAVRNVIDWVSFDVNTKPQVFETTIRVLGGLLSGHIFASQDHQKFYLPWYKGELLDLAHDLGERLLPAFGTPTGLPIARINLRHGLQRGETFETCTAGAGSLILEFGTLSRLTGDSRFEKAAYKAFFALWNRKSDIGLVGNTINTFTGTWNHPEITSIGAGIDSFYEYALKWYVLSGEVEFLDVWQEAYAAIMRYARASDGHSYRSVNIHTGDLAYHTGDSLSAFWPGLQVLAGDVENAIKSHLIFWNLWQRHSGLPEIFDFNFRIATSLQYPLRPEFVESTWYLYRATRDPFYLDVGERILRDIIARAKVECGLAGIQDLRTNKRDDRMESFVLSETLKYLFLLFDEDNPLNSEDSNMVLTTEGHMLTLPQKHLKPLSPARRRLRGSENLQCPTYQPTILLYDDWEKETGFQAGIRSRTDIDYSRELVGLVPTTGDEVAWSPYGWCELPKLELYSYDFILSSTAGPGSEDFNPASHKLTTVPDGYVIHNVTGIRTHIVRRLDGKGYDITRLGPHAVHTGQVVYINDSALLLDPIEAMDTSDGKAGRRDPTVQLRFFLDSVDPVFQVQPGMVESVREAIVPGFTASFGADLTPSSHSNVASPIEFGHGDGVRLVRVGDNTLGCEPYKQEFLDEAVVVQRGDCTFLEKLILAYSAGASGVVVISDDDMGVNPFADDEELEMVGDALDEIAMVVLRRHDGKVVSEMLDSVEAHGFGHVMVSLDPEARTIPADSRHVLDTEDIIRKVLENTPRVLYLNGIPLLNTRLLV